MRLWPFSTRGSRVDTEQSLRRIDPTFLDYGAFQSNDSQIKLWLPERLSSVLGRMSVQHETSRPDVLRRLLFEHVYGLNAFMDLVAWKNQQEAESRNKPPSVAERGIKRSAARISTQMFGKATDDFTLWLPSPLKQELQELARAGQLGVSDYVRRMLVRQLLGERSYVNWQVAIGAIPREWVELERTNAS